MKKLSDSFVYRMAEDTYGMNKRVKDMISTNSYETINPDLIRHEIDTTIKIYNKDPLIVRAVKELDEGLIILKNGVVKDKNIVPSFMPFSVINAGGTTKVFFDLSNTTFVKKFDKVTGTNIYSIENRQLYSILVTASIVREISHPNYAVPSDVGKICAEVWAKMFCKVLNKALGLNINKERYNAFIYFTSRFFLQNMLSFPPIVADNIATSYLPSGKSDLIIEMENVISRLGVENMYEDLDKFCIVLFNNEVTGIMHTRSLTSSKETGVMNTSTFIALYNKMYNIKNLFNLASFNYFLFNYISVNNSDRSNDRKIFEDTMLSKSAFPKVMGLLRN